MIRKLKKFLPWILISTVLLYSLLWYVSALFFEATIRDLGAKMKEKGILIIASSFYSGGYPVRFQGSFQDVQIQFKEGLRLSAPALTIQADFLFPFTKAIHLFFEEVTTLTQEERTDKLLLTNLTGDLCLAPYSVGLHSDSISFLRAGSPLGEFKQVILNVQRELDDKLLTTFEGNIRLWFPNPLAPTLDMGLNIRFLLDNWEGFFLGHPVPREIRFAFESIEARMMGTILKGTGFLAKQPEASWEGEFDLSLQGLTYFFNFLNHFSNQKSPALIKFLTNIPHFLQNDNIDGFKLPLRVRDGKLEFKGIPFFVFPLFPWPENPHQVHTHP